MWSIFVAILYLCIHFNGVFLHPQSSLTHLDKNESSTALCEAIETGNGYEIQRLLTNGVDVNAFDQNGNTALMLAVGKGSKSLVKLLIEKGADIDAINRNNNTALIMAIFLGYDAVAELLIRNGADVNIVGNYGFTAMQLAAEKGFEKIIRMLIERGANVHAVNNDNNSALTSAVGNGFDKVVELLIQNGASVNIVSSTGHTPLIWAAQQGNERIVRILIENGADVNAVESKNKNSALIIASALGYDEIAELLIQSNANVNAIGLRGTTALILAAMRGSEKIVQKLIEEGANVNFRSEPYGNTALIFSSENGFGRIVEILIENGANVNAVNEGRNSSLIIAAANRHVNVVKLLIENGADIDAVNVHNISALMTAISSEHLDIAQALVQKGANVNARDRNGDSALHLAVRTNQAESLSSLLTVYEADPNVVNSIGLTPLELAIDKGNEAVVKLLIEKKASIPEKALINAAVKGNQNIVETLINNGARTNVKDSDGDSALIKAVAQRNINIVKLLIENGAHVNAVGYLGFTPLLKAVNSSKGCVEIVQILIEKGANVNATNVNGDSALNSAARSNQVSIARLLIENDADIEHRDARGRTPLINVAGQVPSQCLNDCQESEKILQLLIDKGATINAVDREDHTALDAAKSEDRDEVMRMLTEHGAERRATLFYRETAMKACRLYSTLTAGQNRFIANRIFDGSTAEIGEFPWMVALGYLSGQYKVSFACGGSLISDMFVLTAAHCVKDINRPVVARLGKVTLTDEDDFRAENQNIREIIPHPKYSGSTRKNDIALIRLIDRLWITEFMQPVCIQTLLRDEHTETNLIVTGWGQVNKSSTSTELLKIDLKTVPLSQCNETFSKYNAERNLPPFQKGIDESQYCANDPIGNKDSCQGDSGGPLHTTQTFSNPAKVVGVVSFGIGCGSGFPGIYTRVAHYIEWIGSHVWPNGEIQTPRIVFAADVRNADSDHTFSSK